MSQGRRAFVPGEWTGRISDRYALHDVVGRGGMGEVWAGTDLVLNRAVAVKVMHEHLALDVVAHGRFQREARAAASLNHPGIAAVYDAGVLPSSPARPYVVMEYVDGQTLADLLSFRIPAVEDAVRWVVLVLEALEYAHAARVVHRDIKPANVMIALSGQVKVMDFGIARVVDGTETGLTGAREVVGTAAYMSPEQVQGHAVDARSDLYSTGCLFYELLTGCRPHIGETPLALAYRHVHEDPLPPSRLRSGLPPQIENVVLRALAKDPDDRFASAADMRAALSSQPGPESEWDPGTGTATEPLHTTAYDAQPREQPSAHPQRPPRRLRLAALAVGALLAMCGVLAASITHQGDGDPAPGSTSGTSASPGPPATAVSPSGIRSTTRGGVTPSRTATAPASPTSAYISMPGDLVGHTLGQARTELTRLGLHVALAAGSATSADATVVATLPPAGTQVARGDTVVVTATSATSTTSSESPAPDTSSSATATATPTPTASLPIPPPPPIG